jgi:hypothetical protein
MTTQSHRNESRFYAYPWQRLVAVLDDRHAVDDAYAKLRNADVDVQEVYLLSGPQGALLLDRRGRRHGLRGWLLRLLQSTSSENDSLDTHDRALRDGKHVLFVPASRADVRERIAGALVSAGGHDLVYFGRFTIEQGWT